MKTSCLVIVLLSSIVAGAQTPGTGTQTTTTQPTLPAPTAYSLVANDANSRVWERTVYEPGPNGTVVPRKHRVTELATGMYYQSAGQWVESKEEIDALPQGGAAATQGAHQVYFPGDIAQGVIQLVTPDGLQLQSRPVALSYDDGSQTVLIAILTNSVGVLVASNQVIYPNAFEGAAASLRYNYTKAGFEQDVIVQNQLPAPESFGLNPATTKLQMLTEFFDANDPVQMSVTTNRQNGLTDRTLQFGTMQMVHGRAFSIGNGQTPSRIGGTSTYKSWLILNGRKFLVEEVPYPKIAPQLRQLPATGRLNTGNTNLVAANSIMNKVSTRRLLPPARPVQAGTGTIQLAKADSIQTRGLVLDYTILNGSTTNYTFQGDTTYYITGPFSVSDTATFEGGTVIKFESGVGAYIGIYNVVCQTAPYRPAIFTAKDDNTVGETITGSSGTPSGYYAADALYYSGPGWPNFTLAYLRFSYAQTAFYDVGNDFDTWNSMLNLQILNCGNAFYFDGDALQGVNFANGLISGANCAFNGYGWSQGDYIGFATQATVNNCNTLANDDAGVGARVGCYNSILANVSSLAVDGVSVVDGDINGFYNSPTFGTSQYTTGTSPFQTVGAGSYYLASGSPFRNLGNATRDSVNVATKTTYPPIVYSNITISVATTFSPQVQLDTNAAPDLGYHYDPIDYFFGGVVANSNVTFTAGTVVGWFELPGSGGSGYGIALNNDIFATFNGTATAPCIFARYSTVQEGGDGFWTDKGWLGGITDGGSVDPSNPAGLTASFTRFSHLAGDSNHFRDGTSGQPILIQAKHCEIYGGAVGYNILGSYTNCLFYRAGFGITNALAYPYQYYVNCTFYGGSLSFGHSEGGSPYWYSYIHNCAFDNTTFSIGDPFGSNTNDADYNYNAFDSGAAQPPTEGANTVVVTGGFNWQSSWFGNFYQATNSPLIDAGDRTAGQLGLAFFTTQTSQMMESNTVVDIGYHYVAVNTSGLPFTDTNGVPYYLQNGFDSGGSGLPIWWELLYFGHTGVDPNADPDGDGLSNLQEYQAGTNPNVDDSTVSSSRLNYIYDAGGWLQTVSGVHGGSVSPDNEGNIKTVSQ